MDYHVRHRTLYRYQQPVAQSSHLAHLLLRGTESQEVRESRVTLTPEPAARVRRNDFFGNPCEWFFFDTAHEVLEVVAESLVRVAPAPPRAPEASLAWEEVRALLENPPDDGVQGEACRDAVQYIFDSPLSLFTADLAGWASQSLPPGTPLLAGAIALMRRIHAEFRYDTGVTDATTPVDRVFEIRAGVCQDLAHVGIAALRSLGLPARYVSGYLLTHPPAGMARMVGADASHAWFSVFAPPFGWVDLDPTNDVVVGQEHVTAAWGRDYGDVAPLGGIILGGHDHVIEVGVDVIPLTGQAAG